MLNIRIISKFTTFYPLEMIDGDKKKITDDLTFVNTLLYVKEQLDEDFHYLSFKNNNIVKSTYRDVIFFCQADNSKFKVKFLKYILHTVKLIVNFLLGPDFDKHMGISVSHIYREMFSKYIDIFLDHVKTNPLCYLNIVHFSDDYNLKKTNIAKYDNVDIISVMIFVNQKLMLQYQNSKEGYLNMESIFLLYLFIKMEYPKIYDNKRFPLREDFTLSDDEIKNKKGFLFIKDVLTECRLSCKRISKDSPYVMLVISKTSDNSTNFEKNISRFMSEFYNNKVSEKFQQISTMTRSVSIDSHDTIIYYSVVNRTNYHVYTSPFNKDILNRIRSQSWSTISDEEASNMLFDMCLKISNLSVEALSNGHTCIFLGELECFLSYNLFFVNSKDMIVNPPHSFKGLNLYSTDGFLYDDLLISSEHKDTSLRVFEVFVIFQYNVRSIDAINDSTDILNEYLKRIKKLKS